MGARPLPCLLIAHVVGFAACLLGCRPLVKPPAVDSNQVSAAAVTLYDKDGDQLLSESELATCGGLLAAFPKYDTTGDKRLGKEEIATRIKEMYSRGTGLMSLDCRVLLDNRPLSSATIRFVPEPFLSDHVKVAEGVTDGAGFAHLGVADDQLPQQVRGLKVVQPGIYRVEVTHPSTKLPARYNTETTLGHELNPTEPDEPILFRLLSKPR